MNETTRERVRKLDRNLRHKSGITANDFVSVYCPVLATHAYATRDSSINEMEKTLTHVLGMYIYHKRFCEILGFDTDPRKFVNAFEDAEIQSISDREKRAEEIQKAAMEATLSATRESV